MIWQLATIAGILAGQVIPGSWQLEFVVPLCFIAVLVPLLRDRVSILVFTVAAIAVIALDAMPLRLSMVCGGLLGIAAGILGAPPALIADLSLDILHPGHPGSFTPVQKDDVPSIPQFTGERHRQRFIRLSPWFEQQTNLHGTR